ncbi:MAG: ABC transporter substrate-binding protein [Chloroflexota bacterium]|jgi:multiple sugar transport system substrate-binding protein|nr:ABC transporter substrate-binding protein [Anaerolineae bacterium]HMM28087.1 ABC transporter substrate-binding protein [Aggregatilineaceae bacterium]
MRKYHVLTVVVLAALVVGGAGAALARQATTVTLMGWSSSQAEDAALAEQIAAFEEANPDIDVEVNLVPDYDTTLQTTFASGAPPDVFYIDSLRLPDLVEAGVVDIGGDKIENPEGIYPSLVDIFTYNDEFVCPPKDFSTLTLQYNKDMFDAAGLDYPTDDWTWDDLSAAAEALTGTNEEGQQVLGLVIGAEAARWLPFLYQAGGSVLNEDWSEVTFDSEEAREAFDFLTGLAQEGFAGTASQVDAGWPGEAFGMGRAAMTIEGNWIIQFLADQFPDINWGAVQLPAHPDGGEATMAFTVCYGVAADSDNKDAAWQLVNFLTGEEGGQIVAEAGFGPMPPRMALAETWLAARGEEIGQPFVNAAEVAYPWSFPVGFGDVLDTFNAGMQLAFQGQATADDVIFETAAAAEEVLAR